MRITSFAYQGDELSRVQVELELIKGLPGMTILGLPDTLIRESAHRIQSALIQQGFEWPTAEKIIVHLMPSSGKKSGEALDLAIALLLLAETGQWAPPFALNERFHAYGQLTLSGEVLSPGGELDSLPPPRTGDFLISGAPHPSHQSLWRQKTLENLRQAFHLAEGLWSEPLTHQELWARPQIPDLKFPLRYKRWISALAAGEHHALLCGVPGTGKSTLAKSLIGFRRPPSEEESYEILKTHRSLKQVNRWRPVVSPHHTSSSLALLGGGVPIRAGAISRSHGGLLVMDELLEFRPQVQEALREPLEEGRVHLYRGHHYKSFPARFQLIATTNLCPCGHWTPAALRAEHALRCKCSQKARQAYQAKLSGPILDRIALWIFMTPFKNQEPTFGLRDLLQELSPVLEEPGPSSQDLNLEELKERMSPQALSWWGESPYQLRRKLQWARLARTLSLLDGADSIEPTHLEEASEWALEPFFKWQDL